MTAQEWYSVKSMCSEKDIWIKVHNKGKRTFKGNVCILRSMTNSDHSVVSHPKMSMLCIKDKHTYLSYKYSERVERSKDNIILLNSKVSGQLYDKINGTQRKLNKILTSYIGIINILKREYEK